MRRRRSVKISSIALEPAQWQNDALHILTSAHDYRSMNDFLMKKVRGVNLYLFTQCSELHLTHYHSVHPPKALLSFIYVMYVSQVLLVSYYLKFEVLNRLSLKVHSLIFLHLQQNPYILKGLFPQIRKT